MTIGDPFPPEICKALDSYAVPPLPVDFADRVMMRIAQDGMAVPASLDDGRSPPSGWKRRQGRPWQRSGRLMSAVIVVSLASATAAAAAAGIFGKPVYVPGVSEVLAKADIVAMPVTTVKPAPKVHAAAKPRDEISTPAAQPVPQQTTTVVLDRMKRLQADPAFQTLTPGEKLATARKEARALVQSGDATRQDVRSAARTMIREASPETRQKWRAMAQERRATRRMGSTQPLMRDPQAATDLPAPASGDLPSASNAPAPAPPSSLGYAGRMRALYRNATPEERAALRRAFRERRRAQTETPVE